MTSASTSNGGAAPAAPAGKNSSGKEDGAAGSAANAGIDDALWQLTFPDDAGVQPLFPSVTGLPPNPIFRNAHFRVVALSMKENWEWMRNRALFPVHNFRLLYRGI